MNYKAIAVLAARFKEPSSWAGLAGIVAILGVNLDPGLLQAISLIGAGVASLAAVFLPEGK